jgi:hypothetical protein
MAGQLSPLSAAATAAIVEVLRAADLPMPTGQIEQATGYSARYGQLTYRMLCRLAARGQAEKLRFPGLLSVYWRLIGSAEAPDPPSARKPGRRAAACATRTVTVRIRGQRQIDTFEAQCALRGRAPHELAHDWVLERIRDGQADHEVQHLAAVLAREDLVLAHGGPRSAAGRREMLRLLDPETE